MMFMVFGPTEYAMTQHYLTLHFFNKKTMIPPSIAYGWYFDGFFRKHGFIS